MIQGLGNGYDAKAEDALYIRRPKRTLGPF